MSDSNSNHIVVPDDDVPLHSVVRALSGTLNAEVEEDSGISCKKKGDRAQATTSTKTPSTLLLKGLIKMKSCKTSVDMAHMMVPLMSKQFMVTAEVTTEMLVQIYAYFAHTGVHNEEYLSFMTNYVNWPPSHAIVTDKQKTNLISIAVTLLISKIATYTVALQEEKLYLSHGISYRALSTWFT